MQAPGANLTRPGNRLEELRVARGLLRSQVAAALLIDQSTVYRWERGANIPDEKKFQLAELLEVEVPYLMGWASEDAA